VPTSGRWVPQPSQNRENRPAWPRNGAVLAVDLCRLACVCTAAPHWSVLHSPALPSPSLRSPHLTPLSRRPPAARSKTGRDGAPPIAREPMAAAGAPLLAQAAGTGVRSRPPGSMAARQEGPHSLNATMPPTTTALHHPGGQVRRLAATRRNNPITSNLALEGPGAELAAPLPHRPLPRGTTAVGREAALRLLNPGAWSNPSCSMARPAQPRLVCSSFPCASL
jgi:hypothetical protein